MSTLPTGPRDLITDVSGLLIGNAEDASALTGVTVLLPEEPVVAAAHVRGGGPGTREIDALRTENVVEVVHGFAISGGSVFGLDAAGALVEWLARRGVGFTFGEQPLPCPVVPSAVLFDLRNGGDKSFQTLPYRRLALAAAEAAGVDFRLGNAGAGMGATAGVFKGGLGSASATWNGMTVGAVVAVNSMGSPADPETGLLWAENFRLGGQRPRLAPRAEASGDPFAWTKVEAMPLQGAGANTTIAILATDANLSRGEAKRLALMASDGMARALRPIHTPFDGDTVFALATGRTSLPEPRPLALSGLGAVAADTLARAIAKGVIAADAIPGWPALRERLLPA